MDFFKRMFLVEEKPFLTRQDLELFNLARAANKQKWLDNPVNFRKFPPKKVILTEMIQYSKF